MDAHQGASSQRFALHAAPMVLGILAMVAAFLGGCSSGMVVPLTITPQTASVRIGSTVTFSADQTGTAVNGVWSVIGGPAYGSIDTKGVYSPPQTVPANTAVTVTCQAVRQTATATVNLLNPGPVITQISPTTLIQLNSPITLTGTGFVEGSQILANGSPVPTSFIDSDHLSATVMVSSTTTSSLTIAVSNPNPGALVSSPLSLPASVAPLIVIPQTASVPLGSSLALTGEQLQTAVPGGVWSVNGGAVNGSVTVSGIYRPPPSIPPANATVTYQALGQTATSTLTIVNPAPTISGITPAQLSELNTPAVISGSGFITGSQVLINGAAVVTTFVDAGHLSATLPVSSISVKSLSVAVSNPNPGAAISSQTEEPVEIALLAIVPQAASVRIDSTLALSGVQKGAPVSGGVWTVLGGPDNGTIGTDGVYFPPTAIPARTVTALYSALDQTASATVTLLNPSPTIAAVSPSTLLQLTAPVTITGSGFLSGSQILADGVPVATAFLDSQHLSAILSIASNAITSVALSVSNPAPGAVVSSSFSMPVAVPALKVSPLVLSGGNITITASIPGLPNSSVVEIDGASLATSSIDATSITATGYLPFWRSGSVTVAVAPSVKGPSFAELDIPIATTAVPYDIAARFAMQAGFGPRHDIIEHIQQVGLSEFVDEQLLVPPDTYNNPGSPPHNFLLNVVSNNTQLRLRTAWAFQSFIPEQGIFLQASTLPWEKTLEAHAFGNFRQILLDATSDPNVTTLLNLPGNWASADPNVHPNQNFARELLQLFSIGTLMLNDDGTTQTDSSGTPLPAYGQDTILDISRALTGWTYAATVNPDFSFYGIDYTQSLVPLEWRHDEGSKTIFGSIFLPAGQTTTQDRDQVLDAVFQHQNVPPFVSRRLIQRFVKSQPSPQYLARISAVFKDDGNGTRGNLAAVIRAILLDPEARSGDSTPSQDDGFVQDPLFAELFAMELMDIDVTDDVPPYYLAQLGEPLWFPQTVFAYYSPDYTIPGTTINSPEFQLLTTTLIAQRSQLLWGMINGPQQGFSSWGSTWLSQTFPTVPTLVDALNHIAYHGTMSAVQQEAITNYCGGMVDQQLQLRCTLLLSLNGDSFTVVH